MIARYLVLGDEMAIVYLEDLSERVGNKYLAVNMIAQRARVLNDRNLQFLNPNSKKCVTEANQIVVSQIVANQIVVSQIVVSQIVVSQIVVSHQLSNQNKIHHKNISKVN